MSIFKSVRKGYKWVGNKAAQLTRFVGDGIKIASNLSTAGNLLGTAVSFYNPVLGASILVGSKTLKNAADGIQKKISKV